MKKNDFLCAPKIRRTEEGARRRLGAPKKLRTEESAHRRLVRSEDRTEDSAHRRLVLTQNSPQSNHRKLYLSIIQ